METSTPALADSDPVAEQVAPPVVAVVVTCNPGWWLEECLASLLAQDYPALSVLVVDADSTEDPTVRVASVMPGAFVRRVLHRRGFAVAANEVLSVVEGASHFVFCHDDVALDPSAVRAMVEEAFRSNAGVVTPKLVGWFHPDRLLAVGMGMDGYGLAVPLVERGDLDQAQHDSVRDVFIAPSPCALIRADLFASLGGFDPGCGRVGEDLDLAWRAHLAGARVIAAPAATVRHLEATEMGRRTMDGTLRLEVADAREDVTPVRPHDHAPLASDEEWDEAWGSDDGDYHEPLRPEAHHVSRRARREAERLLEHEEWVVDDSAWDDDELPTRRRRRRVVERSTEVVPERDTRGPQSDALDAEREVARLRAVFANYSFLRLVTHVPVMLIASLIGAVLHFAREGAGRARASLHPWSVAFADSGAIRARRKTARAARRVSDREVVGLQTRGAARLAAAVRVTSAGPARARRPGGRVVFAGWLFALAVVAIGSRHLLTGHIPLVGEFASWPSFSHLWSTTWSGWRLTGLGAAAAPPTAFGLLTFGAVVFLGHTTLLQHVLVLGMVPLGALGAYRLARPLGGHRPRLVALVAYLAVPLPYDAIATGRWSGLVAYAVTPWLFAVLLRITALTPFETPVDAGFRARPALSFNRRLIALAVLAALAAAVQPGYLIVVIVLGIGLALGGALTAARPDGLRALVASVVAALGALVLLAPWSLSWLPPTGEWASITGAAPATRPLIHLVGLLRFQTGPLGAGLLGYALLIGAALPVVVGRSWRAAWAVRLWVVALLAFGVAWAGQLGALGVVWPPVDVLLAPAAVAVALLIALGMASFDTDLVGFTFGWRQAVAGVAAAATVIACLPVVAEAFDGRWQQDITGYDSLLSWMPAKSAEGDFRVLWLGDPTVLPIAGWTLTDGLAYATSVDGVPDLTNAWPATSHGTTRLLAQAIDLARGGDTTSLGHLLAPMGVRYLVVVQAPAPLDASGADQRPIPTDLRDGLASQLDLRPVDASPQSAVFENAAWVPMRTQLPDGAVAAAKLNDPRVARTTELGPSAPVLPRSGGPTTFSGNLTGPETIEVAQAPSGHWQLQVGGHTAPRGPAFASANLFSVAAPGKATLRYRTPIGWRIAAGLALLLWLAALAALLDGRRFRA